MIDGIEVLSSRSRVNFAPPFKDLIESEENPSSVRFFEAVKAYGFVLSIFTFSRISAQPADADDTFESVIVLVSLSLVTVTEFAVEGTANLSAVRSELRVIT